MRHCSPALPPRVICCRRVISRVPTMLRNLGPPRPPPRSPPALASFLFTLHSMTIDAVKMICNACSETIQSIWDPSSPRRLRRAWEENSDDNLPPDHPDNYVFAHHATSESLSRAISDGCTICKHIEAAVLVDESEFAQSGYFRLPKYDQPGYSFLGVRAELRMLYGLTEKQGSLNACLCNIYPSALSILLPPANAKLQTQWISRRSHSADRLVMPPPYS